MTSRSKSPRDHRRLIHENLPIVNFKVLIVGDRAVGKTSLIRRFVSGTFGDTTATLGVDFHWKRLERKLGTVSLQLWDVAGQEVPGEMTRVFYQGCTGVIIVADKTRPESVLSARRWREEVSVKLADNQPICYLAMNKADLVDLTSSIRGISNQRAISDAELDTYCGDGEDQFDHWQDVSACTGEGVQKLFESLTDEMIRRTGVIDILKSEARRMSKQSVRLQTKQRKEDAEVSVKKRCNC